MNEKEIKEMLQDIQDDLEKLKDTGTDVLFLASKNNRGVISGSMEGIAEMLLLWCVGRCLSDWRVLSEGWKESQGVQR